MRISPNKETLREIEDMRGKWKKGQISTTQYHYFLEGTKRVVGRRDTFLWE